MSLEGARETCAGYRDGEAMNAVQARTGCGMGMHRGVTAWLGPQAPVRAIGAAWQGSQCP